MMGTMTEPLPRQVEITTPGLGGKVIVDGHDISHLIDGVELRLGARDPARVVLHAIPVGGGASYTGPALVELASSPAAPDIAGWLERQAADPTLLAIVIEGSMDSSPMDVLMAELVRRARG